MKLEIVSAGAGSGKTTWLTQNMAESFRQGVAPDRVMATTFTREAAEELQHRLRRVLLAEGMQAEAYAVGDGLLGTINSTVGDILGMFCWEAGLSPRMDVIDPVDAGVLLRTALADQLASLPPQEAMALERFGMMNEVNRRSPGRERSDGTLSAVVEKVINEMRANAISPMALPVMAERALQDLLRYFPEPLSASDAVEVDNMLGRTLEEVAAELPHRNIKKSYKRTAERVDQLGREWQTRRWIAWAEWVALSKVNLGAENKDLNGRLAEVGRHVLRHPQLREDVIAVLRLVYQLAQGTAERFQEIKRERGVVDFTDQEALTYDLLGRDQVRARLKERVQALWVDEFQDSSPLELAVLQELAQIAEETRWVGDPKQAIYGFRGTDPELMNWAARMLVDPDTMRVLEVSHRSRPELVGLVNVIFERAFESQQITARRVVLKADDERVAPAGATAPFEIWHLPGGKSEVDRLAIAGSIAEILNDPTAQLVQDIDTKAWRPIRGRDVAVLCRTNKECAEIAGALNAQGIRASVGRGGLLETPEVGYALAALRLLWDPQDSLAMAELIHLGNDSGHEGRWLAEWLEDPEGFSGRQDPRILALEEGRQALSELTLGEALDRSLVLSEARRVVRGWPNPDIRAGNLEKLRFIATVFEERAQSIRVAPTVPAFLGYLEEIQDDPKNEFNFQAQSHDDDAVAVVTYYKAKGIEWPMVVLTFGSERAADPFGVHAVSTGQRDVTRPLESRWVRYWPWPFGSQQVGVGLTIGQELQDEEERLKHELTRLMYVGMTRARDYLVWVYNPKKVPDGLNGLETDEGRRILTLPTDGQAGFLGVLDMKVPVVLRTLSASDIGPSDSKVADTLWAFRKEAGDLWSRVPRRVIPSALDAPVGMIEEQRQVGPRVTMYGQVDMGELGSMVHSFLAASHNHPASEWLSLARQIVNNWGLRALRAEDLPGMAERYRAFMQERYPNFVEHVEWPVDMVHHDQFMTGTVDSLWIGPKGTVIIDHKTFPGREEAWNDKALGYLGQLRQYQLMLDAAGIGPVRDLWIHFPVVGRMIRIRPE